MVTYPVFNFFCIWTVTVPWSTDLEQIDFQNGHFWTFRAFYSPPTSCNDGRYFCSWPLGSKTANNGHKPTKPTNQERSRPPWGNLRLGSNPSVRRQCVRADLVTILSRWMAMRTSITPKLLSAAVSSNGIALNRRFFREKKKKRRRGEEEEINGRAREEARRNETDPSSFGPGRWGDVLWGNPIWET